MELVECIKDNDYHPKSLQFIENFPVKGDIYTVRKRQHTKNGLGYLLEEIINPIMTNNFEPSFSASRFKPIDQNTELINEILNDIEYAE